MKTKVVIESDIPRVRYYIEQITLREETGKPIEGYNGQNKGTLLIPLASLLIAKTNILSLPKYNYISDKQNPFEPFFFSFNKYKHPYKDNFHKKYKVDISKEYFFCFENIIMMQRMFNYYKSLEPFNHTNQDSICGWTYEIKVFSKDPRKLFINYIKNIKRNINEENTDDSQKRINEYEDEIKKLDKLFDIHKHWCLVNAARNFENCEEIERNELKYKHKPFVKKSVFDDTKYIKFKELIPLYNQWSTL